MQIYVVALVKDLMEKTIGYRLVDLDSKEVMTVDKENLIDAISSNKIKIKNAKLSQNRIMGTRYELKRLGKVEFIKGILSEREDSIIIAYKEIIKGQEDVYVIIDSTGKTFSVSRTMISDIARVRNVVNMDGGYEIKEAGDEDDCYITDEEACDVNIVWKPDRFVDYMEQRGYTYDIQYINNEIIVNDIDYRCKYLKLPYGVTRITCLYRNGSMHPVESIIIPSTVTKIDNINIEAKGFSGEEPKIKIKRLQFQKGNKIEYAMYQGVKGLSITENYNIPYADNICGILCNCVIPYTPKVVSVNEIEDSFNNIEVIDNSTININRAIRIRNCFNDIKNNIAVVNINSDVMIISNSFNSTEFGELNIKKANIINKSFNENKMITKLNLESAKITEIGDSFKKLDNLNEFIAPINIETIKGGSFSDCKITELDFSKTSIKVLSWGAFMDCKLLSKIVLGNNIKIIEFGVCENTNVKEVIVPISLNKLSRKTFNKDAKFIFNDMVKVLTQNLVFDSTTTLNVEDNFRIIDKYCFRDLECDVKMHDKIEEIGDYAFKSSGIEEFDTREIPLVKSISNNQFDGCKKLTTVIIWDNIESIGEKAFVNCESLKNVIISNKVKKLGSRAFYGAQAKDKTNVFVYLEKGSALRSKLMKLSNISVIDVNNLDGALEKVKGKQSTPENIQDRFKMMASSKEDVILLDNRYVGNITFIKQLLSTVRTKKSPYKDIGINSQKFNHDAKEYRFYSEIIKEKIKSIEVTDKCEDSSKLRARFIQWCNLITSLADNNKELLSEQFIDWCRGIKVVKTNDIYIDSKAYIGVIKISETSRVLVIAYDCKILLTTPINYVSPITHMVLGLDSVTPYISVEDNTEYVTKYIAVGDMIGRDESVDDARIGSALIPREMNSELSNNVYKDMVLLSYHEVENNNREINLYSLSLNKIFKAEFNGSQAIFHNAVYRIHIKEIIDIKSYMEIKKYADSWCEALCNKYVKAELESKTLNREKLEKLKSRVGAYDKNCCINSLLSAAKECNNSNVNLLRELRYITAKQLIESGLFEKANLSLKQIENSKDIIIKSKTPIQLVDDESFIIEYYLELTRIHKGMRVGTGNCYYVFGVIDEKSTMNSKDILYKSNIHLKAYLNMLKSIGNGINNGIKTYSIDDNIISNKDYTDLMWMIGISRTDVRYRIALSIENASGEAYLTCGLEEEKGIAIYKTYKMLRFKNLKSAIKHYEKFLIKTTARIEEIAYNKYKEIVGCNAFNIAKMLRIELIRTSIINGAPNDYPYYDEKNPWHTDLFEDLAKQEYKI